MKEWKERREERRAIASKLVYPMYFHILFTFISYSSTSTMKVNRICVQSVVVLFTHELAHCRGGCRAYGARIVNDLAAGFPPEGLLPSRQRTRPDYNNT